MEHIEWNELVSKVLEKFNEGNDNKLDAADASRFLSCVKKTVKEAGTAAAMATFTHFILADD